MRNLLHEAFRTVAQEQATKECAAISVCGSNMGNNYVMAEIIESFMLDAMQSFDKKWYRQSIKKLFRDAYDRLHDVIVTVRAHSLTDSWCMMDVADTVYDRVRTDYFAMHFAVTNEILRHKCKYAKDIAHIICMDAMLSMARARYDSVIEHMKGVYSAADYDSWYGDLRLDAAYKRWMEASHAFSSQYMTENIDPNEMQCLKDGIHAMHNHIMSAMDSDDVNDICQQGNKESIFTAYNKSLETLGVKVS